MSGRNGKKCLKWKGAWQDCRLIYTLPPLPLCPVPGHSSTLYPPSHLLARRALFQITSVGYQRIREDIMKLVWKSKKGHLEQVEGQFAWLPRVCSKGWRSLSWWRAAHTLVLDNLESNAIALHLKSIDIALNLKSIVIALRKFQSCCSSSESFNIGSHLEPVSCLRAVHLCKRKYCKLKRKQLVF